jgi:hypothetical protein
MSGPKKETRSFLSKRFHRISFSVIIYETFANGCVVLPKKDGTHYLTPHCVVPLAVVAD